jgi:L-threonylcarbamoyladenylate synthase
MIKTKTEVVASADLKADTLKRIAQAAKNSKIIAFPTDTVYGLGSTGLVKAAARRIYQIKERPTLKPLPILVHSTEAAKKWVEWTPAADRLAKAFWPGALTLVLRPSDEGRILTFAEYQTVAIRVPNHPLLLELIGQSGVPWVSTSANLSGSPALSDGAEVARQFDGLVDYVIDGGRAGGVESTLVDASTLPVRVLRQGALKQEQILEALG